MLYFCTSLYRMNTKLNTILSGILFTGLGIFSYLLLVNYTDLPKRAPETFYSLGACVFFIAAFNLVGYATIRLSAWINNQYTQNFKKKRKVIAVYMAVMFSFLLLNYGLLITAKLLAGASHPFTFPNGGIRILISVWLVELVILALVLANKSIQNALKLQQKAAYLQEENDKARYIALQNQLNPHFLFNSLNTLIAEIEYNPANAVNFTKNLSNVYRYVLQCQDRQLVSLAQELEFSKAYLFLHEVRLGNCIRWQTDLPADYEDYLLPPLTLQLLIENIIKHNSITLNKPVTITIGIESGYLVVCNTVNPKKNEKPSGIGLKNLSNRCKLISGKDIIVSGNEEFFTVKIPILI